MTLEKKCNPISGWQMLPWTIVMGIVTVVLFATAIAKHNPWLLLAVAICLLITILLALGLKILQPNHAAVLLLFGEYRGTIRDSGFWWVNPFYIKRTVSLRLRNLNGDKLKVNDKNGNPIEIAAVIVWRVEDTYDACFEVDDFHDFVCVQSDAALRHLASRYPYDSWEEEEVISLRGHIDEVSEALKKELLERLEKAGVIIQEARLSHLAYAPEIAEAMLRRQQAGAVISARRKIVEGAVGMVRMALEQLSNEKVIEMDDERRAAMVTNLLVVLCSESNAQPVINAGTLYH
ncbi:MAG: SPFH domain-containing protein [bacterium]|nr:SPFH domain-containing protein [Candidatus Sumerlaeota bacterium]